MLPHPCYLKIAPKSNRRKQPKQTTSKSNRQKPTSQLLIFLSNLRQLPPDPLQSVIDGFWRFPKDYGNLLVIVAVKVESYHFFFELAQVLFDVALDDRYIFLVDYDVFRIYKFGRLECIGKCLAGIVFCVGVERRVKGNVGVERRILESVCTLDYVV